MNQGGTLYFNAKLSGVDLRSAQTGYLIVERGIITHRGIGEPPAELVAGTGGKVNLEGKTLLPGFVDSHVHVWKVGQLKKSVLDVRGAKSIEDIQSRLSKFARENTDAEWIQARGFNETLLKEKRTLTRQDLDAVISDRPVFLQRTCAHIGVANSRALEKAQLSSASQSPLGGRVETDSRGRLTGVLAETAMGLVTSKIPRPTTNELKRMIKDGVSTLHSYGITAACDPGAAPQLLDAYRELDDAKEIALRCQVMALHLSDDGARRFELAKPRHSSTLRLDGVKYFADGGLSGATAALRRTYRCSHKSGLLRLSQPRFLELAKEACTLGHMVASHAIGDAAIDLVLSVYNTLRSEFPKARLRIEHCGLPRDEHWAAMKELGVTVSTQPIFLYELGKNFREVLESEDVKECYPFASLKKSGVRCGFSSDAPVVRSLSPWTGIEAALLRRDEEGVVVGSEAERMTLAQSLELYTRGSAEICDFGTLVGKLEQGCFADFTVWDRNPFELDAHRLGDMTLLQTFVNGKCVFDMETYK